MQILDELFMRYPVINPIRDNIENATKMLISVYKNGGKLLVCGNGGSAADSEHIVGELMKSFKIKRPVNRKLYDALGELSDEGAHIRDYLEGALPAISLTSQDRKSTRLNSSHVT